MTYTDSKRGADRQHNSLIQNGNCSHGHSTYNHAHMNNGHTHTTNGHAHMNNGHTHTTNGHAHMNNGHAHRPAHKTHQGCRVPASAKPRPISAWKAPSTPHPTQTPSSHGNIKASSNQTSSGPSQTTRRTSHNSAGGQSQRKHSSNLQVHRPRSRKSIKKRTSWILAKPGTSDTEDDGPAQQQQPADMSPMSPRRQSVSFRRQSVVIVDAWKKEQFEQFYKRRKSTLTSTNEELSEPEKVPPIQVFRRVARLVRLLCSVCIAIRSYAIGKGLLDDYLVAVSHRTKDEDGDMEELTFNLKDFKIKKELEVPFSTQMLLQKRPEDRTPEDIVVIGRLMRGLPSFRKYTREMQHLFCKIVRYMKCQQNRVVLRKGHIGYNLYFIYTGACSVVLDKGDANVFVKKEVIMLKKGACFGEIALVQNTRRNATVICCEDTEFLVVDKDLFLDNGLNHQMEQEFHFRYNIFRTLPIISHWTDAQVHDLSNVSRTEEFGYNKVVVKDSRHNDWLWFVIKGSCDIIRLVDLEKCPTFKQTVLGSSPEERRSLEHLAAATRGSLIKPCDNSSKNSSTWSLMSDTSQLSSQRESLMPNRKLEDISEIDDVLSALKASDEVETVLDVMKKVEPQVEPEVTKQDDEKSDMQDAGYGLFFKVDTLRDGQCFGLDTVGDLSSSASQREFVMISRGCEVIHVPKTRFVDIADALTMAGAAKMCKTYPSDDALCARFLARCKWDSYKQEVVQDVITHKSRGGFEAGLRGSGAHPTDVEDRVPVRDRVGAQEMRETVMGRTISATPESSTVRHRPVRPHTSFGARSKDSTQKAMQASWEMDLDMMKSISRSRDGSRRARPQTCPPGSASSRREALLASYTRGSHLNTAGGPNLQGVAPHPAKTSKTLKSGAKMKTGLTPRTGKNTVMTPRGYQVEGTNVFVKGSQRTLQIVSNLRSCSHEDRLHKIRNK